MATSAPSNDFQWLLSPHQPTSPITGTSIDAAPRSGDFFLSNSLRARVCPHYARGHMGAHIYNFVKNQQRADADLARRPRQGRIALIHLPIATQLTNHACGLKRHVRLVQPGLFTLLCHQQERQMTDASKQFLRNGTRGCHSVAVLISRKIRCAVSFLSFLQRTRTELQKVWCGAERRRGDHRGAVCQAGLNPPFSTSSQLWHRHPACH